MRSGPVRLSRSRTAGTVKMAKSQCPRHTESSFLTKSRFQIFFIKGLKTPEIVGLCGPVTRSSGG